MKHFLRAARGLSLFLWVAPPVVSIIYLLIPMSPGCPVNPFGHSESLIIAGALIGLLWLIAAMWTVWIHKNRPKATLPAGTNQAEFVAPKRAILGFCFCALLTLAAMTYAGIEIGNRAIPLWERRQYIANNTATVLYESDDYNAFPKLLKLQDGRLWSVWYQGDWHIDTHNDGKLLQAFSSDNGSTWGSPIVVADDGTYDTRNPAIGQLANGTLILMYFLYNSDTRAGMGSGWLLSYDGGSTWSAPILISDAQFSPVAGNDINWISPFGNIFVMNGHYVSAFYGGLSIGDENVNNQIVLLEYLPLQNLWQHYATPMGDAARGYNEADIEWVGDRWVCISRTTEDILYYDYSFDGLMWSTPVSSGLTLGHSPDMVVMGLKGGIWELFCCYRGEEGLLRGGLATFDPTSGVFSCEHAILYAAEGKGGGDFGYPSAVALSSMTVGFVNYDVIVCCDAGCEQTHGKILWQLWNWQ